MWTGYRVAHFRTSNARETRSSSDHRSKTEKFRKLPPVSVPTFEVAVTPSVKLCAGKEHWPTESSIPHVAQQVPRFRSACSASVTRCPSSWATASSSRAKPAQPDAGGPRADVEPSKPSREDAPSRYAVIGPLRPDPAGFGVPDRAPPGRGGEIQLTDALRELAADGTVHGVVFDGLRYDTGDKADRLRPVHRLSAGSPEEVSRGPARGPCSLPRHRAQPFGRRVQTTVISPVTAPSPRWISMATGNSGRSPASSCATTSAAGRPSVAVAVTAPMASFL